MNSKTNSLLSLLIPLLIALTGCGSPAPSTKASPADSDLHKWTTSAPLHSYEWLVDGKEVGGGSQAESSSQVQLNLKRDGDVINWTMQVGSQSGSGSDSIRFEPSSTATMRLAPDGALAVSGPTSLCRIEERGASGQLVKTLELIVK